MMAKNQRKNQYPAYALKSDDGRKTKEKTNILPMPLKAMMAKTKEKTNILAYAVKSDDGRKTKEKTDILPMP